MRKQLIMDEKMLIIGAEVAERVRNRRHCAEHWTMDVVTLEIGSGRVVVNAPLWLAIRRI